jgi:hypothetical protein
MIVPVFAVVTVIVAVATFEFPETLASVKVKMSVPEKQAAGV